jgi:1-acyl-sn-glycerol-3-phosphate acyltransferase
LRFLAKAELTKIPLLGFIIRKLYMTVNRDDRADRNRSIEIMRRSLDENISVFLCPEGTRNRHDDPPLLDFRDGAFRLAILTKTPLAVLTLLNTGEKLSPLRPIELAPGTLHAIWDEPIDTSKMTIDDVPALKEKVRQMMIGHLMGYRGEKVGG